VKDSFLNFLDVSESNHQDTSSESQTDESHFCKVGAVYADVHDTSIQIAATRLLSVGLYGILAPSDFHLSGPLKKHLGGHRCQTECGSA